MVIDPHTLVVRKNGYIVKKKNTSPDSLRSFYNFNINLKKIYEKPYSYPFYVFSHYLFPGLGQRDYYKTDKMNWFRGWGYHVLHAASIWFILNSRQQMTDAMEEFDREKNIYNQFPNGEPQDSYDASYLKMQGYNDSYIKHENNLLGGLTVLSLTYTINLFEISFLRGR